MTIDDAINEIEYGYGSCENLADTPCNECIGKYRCSIGTAYQTLVDFAKWYRNQDLIQRNKVALKLIDKKDKIREFLDRGYNTEEIVTYFIDLVIFEPKAEPPKE